MRQKILVVLILYLLAGALWASVAGYGMWDVGNRLIEHDHRDEVVDVTDAFVDGDGVVRICLRGRRESCAHRRPSVESFSVTIPAATLWRDRPTARELGFRSPQWGPRWLFVPRERVEPACDSSTPGEPAEIMRLPETDPSEYFDGLDERELETLRPPEGRSHAVFEIPMSFDGARFHERRQVVYVASEPDGAGLRYYDVRTEPLVGTDEVSGAERAIAFTRDVVTFPYQILMLFGSTH